MILPMVWGQLKGRGECNPPQPSVVKWYHRDVVKRLQYRWSSSGLSNNNSILPSRGVHFVDKFLTANIAASIFVQLCLHFAGDDLLLGMTIQLHAALTQPRSKPFSGLLVRNVVMAPFVFSPVNHNGENEKR
ncbi:hypothetical protein TNCV_3848291 [Trichonephila clavipes]|uniref:Uncharacterized protein n=1 Tax=Trichonephila clavipes TaxID=2585209 RepID=A0A8X6V203_TRICX|nr:hypothetical protein TNCV_3848291 [Trichonephila clavipes]